MSKKEIKKLLKKTGALKFGEFKLSSGKKSNYYIDIKKASTEPSFLETIGKEISNEVNEEDKLAGVALGGIPLVVTASIYSDKPYLMIRKQKKQYGTAERIEGNFSPNEEIMLIEDVTTTGNSLLDAVKTIRKAGGTVKKAMVVVDRDEGAIELLEKNEVNLIPLLSSKDLLKESD